MLHPDSEGLQLQNDSDTASHLENIAAQWEHCGVQINGLVI